MREITKGGVGLSDHGPPRLPFPRLQRSAKLYFLAAREPISCTTEQLDTASRLLPLRGYPDLLASLSLSDRLREYLEGGIHLGGPVKP